MSQKDNALVCTAEQPIAGKNVFRYERCVRRKLVEACVDESFRYSRDHNRLPDPASALFSSHGPPGRGLSTSVLVGYRGHCVIYPTYRIKKEQARRVTLRKA